MAGAAVVLGAIVVSTILGAPDVDTGATEAVAVDALPWAVDVLDELLHPVMGRASENAVAIDIAYRLKVMVR